MDYSRKNQTVGEEGGEDIEIPGVLKKEHKETTGVN